jgi:hypothetical protein
MSWQPFSTAPTDGRLFFGFDTESGLPFLCRFEHQHGRFLMYSNAGLSGKAEGSRTEVFHWMPLPDPPRLPVDEETK